MTVTNPALADDPRVRRVIAITEAMAAVAERKALIAELMAEGISVSSLAAVVGLHRSTLYAIVRPRSGRQVPE
jgi:copper homeostasis protein CutC